MSEKWSKEFDSCFQVGSIEEIADALETVEPLVD